MNDAARASSAGGHWLDLAGFVALCLSVGAVGGYATSTTVGGWYQRPEKPGFTPPDGVFAPVWTVLYLVMAVAGWRVWRAEGFAERGTALALFGAQLALNLLCPSCSSVASR